MEIVKILAVQLISGELQFSFHAGFSERRHALVTKTYCIIAYSSKPMVVSCEPDRDRAAVRVADGLWGHLRFEGCDTVPRYGK